MNGHEDTNVDVVSDTGIEKEMEKGPSQILQIADFTVDKFDDEEAIKA